MLQVENLSIVFGGLRAVDNLSFDVPAGSIYGIIGPNGAGKTTVFNMISGALRPTSGRVLLEGKDMVGLQPWQINHNGIARTYQNLNIFGRMTVEDNILVGRHAKVNSGFAASAFNTRKNRRDEAAQREYVRELMDFLGLLDKAANQAKNLSYGEQRRLEIARALASEPKLILLDEPAAGMNTAEKAELSGTIQKIRSRGITVLLIEHDMKLVMGITDQICAINYGKKIVEGAPETVRNNPQVIEAYLGGGKHVKVS